MKKLFLLFCFMALIGTSPARASEIISSFHSEIQINQDTSINIQEKIEYQTDEVKHGIFRYIPVEYTRNGLNYSTKIRNINVTDESGHRIPFEESKETRNKVLKIGDGDKTFTGKQTYVITYQVSNAVQQPNNATEPELYWDITGEGWQVDIATSSATITSPYANFLRTACYSGVFGSDDQLCTFQQLAANKVTFSYPEIISYGDNMTVALSIDPNGGVVLPSAAQLRWQQFLDNLALLPLLLPGLIMTLWWWLKGRDLSFSQWNVFNHNLDQPQKYASLFTRRPIPMVYEPIKELSPAQAATLVNESVSVRDIVAEIIDLARKKYLKIERLETKKLFGKNTDYIFTKLNKDESALPKHQALIMTHLFSTDQVKLSALKGKFYTHIEKINKEVLDSLVSKNLFVAHPNTARLKMFGLAIGLIILASMWFAPLMENEIFIAIPIFTVSVGISLWLAWHAPAKSAVGTNFAYQAKGLKQTIARGAWREKIKEKHLFFEAILPFAIAFGVVDKLAKDMKDIAVKPPTYLPVDNTGIFTTNAFVNSFVTQASTSLSYNPNSGSYSSGSGFSGGSSGGGGGGGGGGSW